VLEHRERTSGFLAALERANDFIDDAVVDYGLQGRWRFRGKGQAIQGTVCPPRRLMGNPAQRHI